MPETKYGKYFMREPQVHGLPINADATLNPEVTCDIVFNVCTGPGPDIPPHKHDVDEYIFFLGGNPQNYKDFPAEIEMCMGYGKDRETHIINTATIIYIPKGLVHLPWNFGSSLL